MKPDQSILENNNFIRPLCEAENEFLQVLLSDFKLKSVGKGLELTVKFNYGSPAIWLRQAKNYLRQNLSSEQRTFYQDYFKKLFEKENIDFDYSDASFPFRFGNGGTLPVVRVGEEDYYCLFYRDIHPIGWNIANGGANNLNDLLNPASIIERELREELIIVEPLLGQRYVFDWDEASLRDHPDFALANNLWMEHFRKMGYPEFSKIQLPLKWIPAYDANHSKVRIRNYDSISVKFGGNLPVHTGYGLLNINGEDFGIEFDRIAKLSVGPEAIFCDGELIQGKLLNQVVGLFQIQKFNDAFLRGDSEFYPDLLFWNGQNRTGENLSEVVEEYLQFRAANENGKTSLSNVKELKFNLCPVTFNLIHRFLQIENQPPKQDGPYDIFISFASQDKQLAKKVYDNLAGEFRVFFSDIEINQGPFAQQIDNALDTAWALIVVGSKPEHLNKTWVQYEWNSFHGDILSGRKPKDTPLIAFVTDLDINDLPRPFRDRQAIMGELNNLNDAIQRLKKFIYKP
jgi:hypothetical protein